MANQNVVMRNMIPILIVGVVAVLMISQTFINEPTLKKIAYETQRQVVSITGFALVVGGLSLMRHNYRKVKNKTNEWQLSFIVFATFAFFLAVNLVPPWQLLGGTIYTATIGNMGQASSALMAFFMTTMAYRAFKVRNFETFIFMLGCVIALFGNAPVGESVIPFAPGLLTWTMNVPQMAATRSITIGVGLAVLAYGIRLILGYDRTVLGEFK